MWIRVFLLLLFISKLYGLPLSSDELINCQYGRAQSPIFIDLSRTRHIAYPEFSFSSDYRRATTFEMVMEENKTLSITLPTTELKSLIIRGGCLTGNFTFQSAHLHWPASEHRFSKNDFIAEAHFIHKNLHTNQTVVLAYFFQPSKSDSSEENWKNPWDQMIDRMNQTSIHLTGGLFSLMQGDVRRFIHYQGSLTTPPCTEGILWVLVASHISLSDRSIRQLQRQIIDSNYRSTQPLNERLLTRSFSSFSAWMK